MDSKRVEEIAANRLKIITPLLDGTLDRDKFLALKEETCIRTGMSERTIRRWLHSYKDKGFDGLKPQHPGVGGKSVIPEDIITEAIALRREVPRRSVSDLIRILEWEGKAMPGEVKRSTLQDQLNYRGYSSRQMMAYSTGTVTAKRYQKPWRNYLWQSDIKYGIYVNGQPTYMVCVLDDCTRSIMHSEFYPTLDQKIVQDCLRKALLRFGAPDSILFDNGSQYRTHWMQRACGKLGIRLLYAKPYHPQGKGKQERYNETVDSFLREASAAKPKDLDELNRLYRVWMDECYLNRPHSALDGKTPREAYETDPHELRFLTAPLIADAFLSCEKRKVDKSGCISFCGQKYEVALGLSMLYKNVDVVYDPSDISELTVECQGFPSCKAVPLVIGRNSGAKPSLPVHFEKSEPSTSRLLDAAVRKNEERLHNRTAVLSITSLKEGEHDV